MPERQQPDSARILESPQRMTHELRSKVFDSLGTQGLYLRFIPSSVVNQRNLFPLEPEDGQKTFVDLADVLILPITSRVIGLWRLESHSPDKRPASAGRERSRWFRCDAFQVPVQRVKMAYQLGRAAFRSAVGRALKRLPLMARTSSAGHSGTLFPARERRTSVSISLKFQPLTELHHLEQRLLHGRRTLRPGMVYGRALRTAFTSECTRLS